MQSTQSDAADSRFAGAESVPAAAPAEPQPGELQPTRIEAPTPREIGGRDGPDPTRFGDWEKNGRCIDF